MIAGRWWWRTGVVPARVGRSVFVDPIAARRVVRFPESVIDTGDSGLAGALSRRLAFDPRASSPERTNWLTGSVRLAP